MMGIVVQERALRTLLERIFLAKGSDPYESALISAHLVEANLRGVDGHGAMLVNYYIDLVDSGTIKANVSPTLVSDNGNTLAFDGRHGFGQRVAHDAIAQAIARCLDSGVVVVALRNVSHVGRLGTYGEQAARAGLASLHFVNVWERPIRVAPVGGSEARLNTNPICLAMPRGQGAEPIVLDFATSSIALGRALIARHSGTRVSPGSLVDAEGRPTTDPEVLFTDPPGAMRPFGGYKGYGLSLFAEIFAGALGGGGTIASMPDQHAGTLNSMLSVLIDPARFTDAKWLNGELERLVSYVQLTKPIDPERPVTLPGDDLLDVMAFRRTHGIPLDDETAGHLKAAAQSAGLSRAEIDNLFGSLAELHSQSSI